MRQTEGAISPASRTSVLQFQASDSDVIAFVFFRNLIHQNTNNGCNDCKDEGKSRVLRELFETAVLVWQRAC